MDRVSDACPLPDDELREVCHDPLHDDLLLLLPLCREHLRVHVLQRLGPHRRRGPLLLRHRVRVRRVRLPPELRLRRLSGAWE
jgi:hypothetical protein